MKAIDVNKRCCTCKHETDKCVKMSIQDGLDMCFDTNEVDVDEAVADTIREIEEDRDWYLKYYVILLVSVFVTFIVFTIWQCCK